MSQELKALEIDDDDTKQIVSTDRYLSDKVMPDPAREETREKYFKVYNEYVLSHATVRQLAEKHKKSEDHISRIIKYCVYKINKKCDRRVYQQTIIDKVSIQLQTLENMLLDPKQGANTIKEKIMVIGEIRRSLKLQAQVTGLMAGEEGNSGGTQPQINIILPNINYEQGVASVQPKKAVVDMEQE